MNFIRELFVYSKKIRNQDLDLNKSLTDELAIKDIDKPIDEYGMIYKYDIEANEFDNSRGRMKRKLKSFLFAMFLVLSSLRYLLYIIISHKEGVPDYCFDFVKEMGGLVVYFYFAGFDVSIFLFGFHYYFNHSNKSDMNWIQILKVLKGVSPLNELKIIGINAVKTFIINIQRLNKLFRLMILTIRLSFLAMIIVVIIFVYDFLYLIKFGLLSSIIFYIWVYYVVALCYYSVQYFYTVCYYCKIRMKSLNDNTEAILKISFISLPLIDKLLEDHNNIFKTIINYNRFWKKIFFILIYSFIPFNLTLLHQLLFEDLPKQSLIAIGFAFTFATLFLFSCNLMTASVLSEVLRSEKLIHKILTKMGPIVNTKRKLKVK